MYQSKLLSAIEYQKLENEINKFLSKIKGEVVSINISDTKANYVACILYKELK